MADLSRIIDAYRAHTLAGVREDSIAGFDVLRTVEHASYLAAIDPTGVSAWALLRASAMDLFRKRSFTVEQLLKESEPEYLSRARGLLATIDAPELVANAQELSRTLSAAVAFYRITDPAAAEIAADPMRAGLVGMEALVSLRSLPLHFFRTGTPSPVKPRFVGRILEFPDIPALVSSLSGNASGPTVLLALIRTKRPENSFFAFGICDGGTVAVITDSPAWSHPLQAEMTRQPARRMEGRAMRNAFPYELIDKNLAVGRGIEPEGLVPHSDGYKTLVRLADLPAENGLWIFMMLDMALTHVREQSAKSPPLAVTGRQFSTALLGRGKENLPAVLAEGLPDFGPLQPEEMTADAFASAYEGTVKAENLWMEERYRPHVDERCLETVVDGQGKLVALPAPGSTEIVPAAGSRAVPDTFFGSLDELRRTRVYLARYNLVEAIRPLAEKEYEETRADVVRWWHDAVKGNLPRLIQAVREGGMQCLRYRRPESGESVPEGESDSFSYIHAPGEIMRISDVCHTDTVWSLGCRSRTPGTFKFGGPQEEQYDGTLHLGAEISSPGRGSHWRCFSGKGKASKVAEFYPDSAHCLADLAGVSVDELPEVLRHWTQFDAYVGNSILGAVDPVNWRLRNPWRRIMFRVRLNMSDSTYRKIVEDRFKMPCPQD